MVCPASRDDLRSTISLSIPVELDTRPSVCVLRSAFTPLDLFVLSSSLISNLAVDWKMGVLYLR